MIVLKKVKNTNNKNFLPPSQSIYLIPSLRLETAPCLDLAASFFLAGSGVKLFHNLIKIKNDNFKMNATIARFASETLTNESTKYIFQLLIIHDDKEWPMISKPGPRLVSSTTNENDPT